MLMLKLLPLLYLTTAQSPMDSDRFFMDDLKNDPTHSNSFFDLPSAAQEDSLLKNIDLPPSPLDSPSSNTKVSDNDRSMVDDLGNLSQCQKDCSKGLVEAFGLILKSMTHVERYNKICQRYNESSACILEEEKCGREDHSMFETTTSGIRYMCLDQQLAFQSTIECIDKQATIVQGECETECNTKSVVMNWIMRSSLARQIQGGIQNNFGGLQGALGAGQDAPLNVPPQMGQMNMLDPAFFNEFRDMSGQMCRVGDCVLVCLKNKFDSRCEGSAGTLLSEVLVRPIAASQEKLAMISPIMGMFVPQPCDFLYSGSQLAKHRIDPLMDGELRRMYAEKELEKAKNETDSSPDASDVSNGVFDMDKIDSPLDSPLDKDSSLRAFDAEVAREEEIVMSDGLESNSSILRQLENESSITTDGSGDGENGSGDRDLLSGSGEVIESSSDEENIWIITEKLAHSSQVWRRRIEANEAITVRSHMNGTLMCRLSRL